MRRERSGSTSGLSNLEAVGETSVGVRETGEWISPPHS